MRLLAPDFEGILAAVRIVSSTRYEIDGEGVDVTDVLVTALENDLYRRFYCRPRPGTSPLEAQSCEPSASRALLCELSEANTGTGMWELGWRVESVDEAGLIGVRKDELTVWARPDQFRPGKVGVRPGATGALRVGKEFREMQPGYYMALGNTDEGDAVRAGEGRPRVVRLYWHLLRDGAVPLIRTLTTAFNRAGISFRCKVLSNPDAYTRADAAVTYVRRRTYRRAARLIGDVHTHVAPHLRPETPLFTKPLLPGLGFAEDPGDGNSFGQSRCRALAQALWSAFEQGSADREAAVAAALRRHGIDPARPYLSFGTRDVYSLPRRSAKGRPRPR